MNRFRFLFQQATETPPAGGGTTTTATTETTTTSLIGSDGSLGENWHTALGDEFAPHAAQLGTFKNVAGLAKSYLHARASGPAYPDANAAAEDVARFHALAKVPTEGTTTAYGIQLAEGITAEDKAMYDRMAAVAHANHLSGPGFAAVVAEFQKMNGEQIATYQAQAEAQQKAAQDELVSIWKGDFEANKSTVRHLTETLATSAGIPAEQIMPLVDNPAFARLVHQMSKQIGEHGVRVPGGFGDLRSSQQKADSIMAGTDPEWGPRYKEGDPEAFKLVGRLLEEAEK